MKETLDQTKRDQVACARCYGRDGRSLTGSYCREAGGQDRLNAFGNKLIHERRQTRELPIRGAPLKLDRASLDPPEALEAIYDRTGSW